VRLGRGRAGHPRDPAPGRPVPPPARARGLRSDHPELQQCRYWLTLGPRA
jgi:hypothetical protein